MSQEPNGNCSEKLVQMNFFILGGFFRVDFPPLRKGGFEKGGFRKNVRLSWLWRFYCQMYCWAQYPWLFFVSLGVTLNPAETPFAKTPLFSVPEYFFSSLFQIFDHIFDSLLTFCPICDSFVTFWAACMERPRSRFRDFFGLRAPE